MKEEELKKVCRMRGFSATCARKPNGKHRWAAVRTIPPRTTVYLCTDDDLQDMTPEEVIRRIVQRDPTVYPPLVMTELDGRVELRRGDTRTRLVLTEDEVTALIAWLNALAAQPSL